MLVITRGYPLGIFITAMQHQLIHTDPRCNVDGIPVYDSVKSWCVYNSSFTLVYRWGGHHLVRYSFPNLWVSGYVKKWANTNWQIESLLWP